MTIVVHEILGRACKSARRVFLTLLLGFDANSLPVFASSIQIFDSRALKYILRLEGVFSSLEELAKVLS